MSERTVVVTGGLGFIGSAFIRQWTSAHPEDHVVNIDIGTYAADPTRLAGIRATQYEHVAADIADRDAVSPYIAMADYVVHFAAESHVDRSIHDPQTFIHTNVMGTNVLLDLARRADVQRFHHVSTDEVYGTLMLDDDRRFDEDSAYAPRSPYAASKAAADHLVRAYGETYGIDYTITNGSNTYGPYQHPEKFIPRLITNALTGGPLPVYGSGENVRDWLHVDDHGTAVQKVLLEGRAQTTYCVGGDAERANIDVARGIAELTGATDRIEFVPDRPGHDLRYALDSQRIRAELGWRPTHHFEDGLAATVAWYRAHAAWWSHHASAAEALYAATLRRHA